MEIVLRTLAVYLALLFLFRISGKRTLGELSTFDLVLILIISEATQNALVGEDQSLVTGLAVIITLILLDLSLSILNRHFPYIEKITEGVPVILVEHGRPIASNMRNTHVTLDDILQAARQVQGLEKLEQIKYAVLENNGGISIIPMVPDMEQLLERHIEQALKRLTAEGKTKG